MGAAAGVEAVAGTACTDTPSPSDCHRLAHKCDIATRPRARESEGISSSDFAKEMPERSSRMRQS